MTADLEAVQQREEHIDGDVAIVDQGGTADVVELATDGVRHLVVPKHKVQQVIVGTLGLSDGEEAFATV